MARTAPERRDPGAASCGGSSRRLIPRCPRPASAFQLGLATALAVITCAASCVAATGAGPLPGAVSARCPNTTPQALPADALAGATRAALTEAPSIYTGLDLRGERATEAVLAPFDRHRGSFASRCGAVVRARTVVVYLEFPAEKASSSLSQGVVLVARFRGVFRVWAVLH